jgi:hypothetical protein
MFVLVNTMPASQELANDALYLISSAVLQNLEYH